MSKNWPKICIFWREMGSKYKILFVGHQRGTALRDTMSFDVLIIKIGAGVLVCWLKKEPKN